MRSTAAHQLRVGKSRTVSVVLLDIANPFFAELVRGAEHVLRDEGYALMVCSSDESGERERCYLRVLEEHRVDGLLIGPVDPVLDNVEAVAKRGIDTVLLDREPGSTGLCAVTIDNVKGGDLAASHLFALGHPVIGFVNGPLTIRQCADRRDGARQALRPSKPFRRQATPRGSRQRANRRARRECCERTPYARAAAHRRHVRQRPACPWRAEGARRSSHPGATRHGPGRLRRRDVCVHALSPADLTAAA